MKYILFTGSHCKSCPQMKVNLNMAGIKYSSVSVDDDSGKMMAGTMQVRALPTLIITKSGKPLETFPGLLTVGKLVEIKNRFK